MNDYYYTKNNFSKIVTTNANKKLINIDQVTFIFNTYLTIMYIKLNFSYVDMEKISKKIIFDTRWFGEHGIGRFAKEVYDDSVFTPIKLKGNPVSMFDVFKLTIYLLFHRSFYFSPGFNAPLFFLNRTAITIHDLNHVDVDANTSFLKRLYYNLILKRACRKAALIFTVSEFSKGRIVDWSGINPDKVKVVYNGVSPAFHKDVKPYLPGFPYIFIVGNRKLHKNEDRALRAFAMANIDKNIHLLFSGKASDQLMHTAKELQIENRIKFLGRLNEEELASTYKGALCLLFPSLYEGFGLPVIEAMACGTPVITSNTTSLIEISENTDTILVNPEDIYEISNQLEKNINYKKQINSEYVLNKFNWNSSKNNMINYLKKERQTKKIIHNGYFLSNIFLNNLKNKDYKVIERINKNKNKNKFLNHLIGFLYLIITIIYRRIFKNSLNKANDQILFFSIDEIELLPYLLWNYRKSYKIYLWLWNPTIKVMKSKHERLLYIFFLKQTGLSIWTFDSKDAIKYNFNYHTQIYSKELISNLNNKNIVEEYDIFFIGQDKNRLKKLKEIMIQLENLNIKYFFYILPDKNKIYSIEDKKIIKQYNLNYNEVLRLISKSKCIIDIVQSGQEGATLRELEALFFNKKLISNRININPSFSRKNILNLDFFYKNPNIIIDFLDAEYQKNGDLNKFDIENLVEKIFINN